MDLKKIDVSKPLSAYDEVLDNARKQGREPNTADRMLAMRAAILAYEADKANVTQPTHGTGGHLDSYVGSHAQQYGVGKSRECTTCGLEIWPANSLRGWGNYKQYCSCVRVQVPK